MFQYFKKFGDKPCCFTDLKVFVDLLPAAQFTQVRGWPLVLLVPEVSACMLVRGWGVGGSTVTELRP